MVESRMTITGNLTRDPQLRISSRTGDPFVVLSVAVNNRRFDKPTQQYVTVGTTFFDVMCFRGLGANALRSFAKGDPVVVHGRFSLKEWAGDNGTNHVDASIDADSVGHDVRFGTTSFSRGTASYGLDPVEDSRPVEAPVPQGAPDAGLTRFADANGEVSDEQAARLRAHLAARQPGGDGDVAGTGGIVDPDDGDDLDDADILDVGESDDVDELAGAESTTAA